MYVHVNHGMDKLISSSYMCIEPFFICQSSSTTNIYNMEPDLRGSYCYSCNAAMTPNELAEVRERYPIISFLSSNIFLL